MPGIWSIIPSWPRSLRRYRKPAVTPCFLLGEADGFFLTFSEMGEEAIALLNVCYSMVAQGEFVDDILELFDEEYLENVVEAETPLFFMPARIQQRVMEICRITDASLRIRRLEREQGGKLQYPVSSCPLLYGGREVRAGREICPEPVCCLAGGYQCKPCPCRSGRKYKNY